jgi:hypothetical protein
MKHSSPPRGIVRGITQNGRRRPVGMAIFLIKLVCKFVDDHVAAVVRHGGTMQAILPGQNNLPLRPRLPRQGLPLLLQHPVAMTHRAVHCKSTRVHQYLAQIFKIVGGSIEDQQAGLGRNDHPHFIRDAQTRTPYKYLFGDEHLHMLLELQLQVGRQSANQRHPFAQNLAPSGGKRHCTHPLAPVSQPIGPPQNGEHKQQRQDAQDEKCQSG